MRPIVRDYDGLAQIRARSPERGGAATDGCYCDTNGDRIKSPLLPVVSVPFGAGDSSLLLC
jgi:hypothetical protein